MILASTKNFSSVLAIRFFVGTWPGSCEVPKVANVRIGLAESTFYPAIQYVIGSWYKGEELAKRACIFHVRLLHLHVPLRVTYVPADRQCHWPDVQWFLADGELDWLDKFVLL